jgi:Zn-finger nucleic acid-binding protein
MKCPVCKKPCAGTEEPEAGLKTVCCGECGGMWLSHKNYAAWLATHGPTLPETPFSEVEFEVEDVTDAKLCPDCGRILLKYKVGHGLDFFVDHCSGCGGVWLDKNEWQALRGRNLHDEIHRIFSTSWQSRVRGDRMREKLEQVYIKRLGEETYQKARSVREWLQSHPQKDALLGFINDEDPYRI